MTLIPRTKLDALKALEEEYRETLRAATALSVPDLEAAGADNTMSRKDVIAHLGWWNWEVPTALERIRRDEMPWWVHLDLDEVNVGPLEERKHWPADRVMDDLRRSHAGLMSALEVVSDQEFHRSTTHKYRDGTLDGMVWLFFIFIEHYEEHRAQLA